MSLNTIIGESPIKQTQNEITDTLYCLGIGYEISYGKTKNGAKTRVITTNVGVFEIFFSDRIRFNGKGSMSAYELKCYLIDNHKP